jgi:hypothetical protein
MRPASPVSRAILALSFEMCGGGDFAHAAFDVGAQGGAGAIMNTGGDAGPAIVVGIFLIAGLFAIGHLMSLLGGLLKWDRDQIVAGALGFFQTVLGLAVFVAAWGASAWALAALFGFDQPAWFLGLICGIFLFFVCMVGLARIGKRITRKAA